MSKKIKNPKEIYHFVRRTQDDILDFEKTFNTFEKAEEYASKRCDEYANDKDEEDSYEWEFFIFKEVKQIKGKVNIKIKKTREVILS